DTVHVRGWDAHWREDPRRDPFGGIERDGSLWGRGACDLKGGICAAVAAVGLLKHAGLELDGRIVLAFIGDEESGEPGTGISAGMKDLVVRVASGEIPKPDFSIYVEPTNLDVYTAQIGFFIADITVTGKTAYFGTPEFGCDALKAACNILSEIWALEVLLENRPRHDLVGSSAILVTSVDTIDRFIAVPGKCNLSVICKLRPGESIDDAVAEFEGSLAGADLDEGISLDITYPACRDHPKGGTPVEIPPESDPVLKLQECVKHICPGAGRIKGAPYWSEIPFLTNQVGCPAVYCAPGNIAVAHTYEERIEVDEYLSAVRAFALFIAQYCGTRACA
ncbi:MAG: M20/M25/M40 family metallo-hydrolase, partial [Rhodobacteraceae bacterium]|nr:M20/M25/M40 family metallo-hydrolase [Paracoccaceae bacterium]